jgi:hypothetical protein
MAHFSKGGAALTPFGKNTYLRSTKGCKFDSYTLAASTITSQTIDGVAGQKIVQSGLVLAKITSGGDTGKVGPYQGGTVQNEVQTLTVTGTPTGGTFTLAWNGVATAPIAFNANAATIQAALLALPNIGPSDLAVTGAGPFTVTFGGNLAGQNVAPVVIENNSLTGGSTPTVATATTTQGGVASGAATDGRGDPANIVGINDTFLPWQTIERDVEVAALYEGVVVQGWCLEYDASGATVALSNATANAMRQGLKGAEILFK